MKECSPGALFAHSYVGWCRESLCPTEMLLGLLPPAHLPSSVNPWWKTESLVFQLTSSHLNLQSLWCGISSFLTATSIWTVGGKRRASCPFSQEEPGVERWGVPLLTLTPCRPPTTPITPAPCFIKGAQCVPVVACQPGCPVWQQMQREWTGGWKSWGQKEHIVQSSERAAWEGTYASEKNTPVGPPLAGLSPPSPKPSTDAAQWRLQTQQGQASSRLTADTEVSRWVWGTGSLREIPHPCPLSVTKLQKTRAGSVWRNHLASLPHFVGERGWVSR